MESCSRYILLEIGRVKGKAKQLVDQQSRHEVDEQVDCMKTCDVEISEAVIESEGKHADEPVRQEFISGTVGIKVVKVPDDSILTHGPFIVKNKGNMEGVGINNNASQ